MNSCSVTAVFALGVPCLIFRSSSRVPRVDAIICVDRVGSSATSQASSPLESSTPPRPET